MALPVLLANDTVDRLPQPTATSTGDLLNLADPGRAAKLTPVHAAH
jgi:hypothetical protein